MIFPSAPRAARKPGFPVGRSWLFYGPPKVGKSSLAAQFPDPFIVDLEDGYEDIGGYVAQPKSLDEVSEVMEYLEGPAGKKFQTVIIDTLDVVHDFVEAETLDSLSKKLKMQLSAIGEAPNGLDWAVSRKSTMGFIEAFRVFARQSGKNVIFVAHAQSVMAEKGTITEKAKTIDFPGKLGRRIPSKVDIIGYCYGMKGKDEGGKFGVNRFVSFQPYEELEAGCRYKELNGKVLPMTFKAIKDCFNK